MVETVTRMQVVNASGGILNEQGLRALYQKIGESKKLAGKAETVINQAILEAFQHHRRGMAMMDGEPFPFEVRYVEEAYEGLVDKMAKVAEKTGKPITATQRRIEELKVATGASEPVAKEAKSFLQNLTHEQAVHGGLWGLSAVLCAFGTWNAAHGIATKDEDGKTHMNLGAVGLTLVQGLLTAGSVYLGAQALRGASR